MPFAMRNNILILFAISFVYTGFNLPCKGQKITNVQFRQESSKVIVNYDLEAASSYQINMLFSTDGGSHFEGPLQAVEGDVGPGISPGTGKQIIWNVLEERESLCSEGIVFKIAASQNMPSMILIEGGSFQMGNEEGEGDEKPVHPVELSSFYLGKQEVTNQEYCIFLNTVKKPLKEVEDWVDLDDPDCKIKAQGIEFIPEAGFENHPAIEITYYGAQAYCEWAGGRLPTEAEWEYAARGGNHYSPFTYSGSAIVDEVAWYRDNRGTLTHLAVGQKKENALGLQDMSGNVWEWCHDWYHKNYYKDSPLANPEGPGQEVFRVVRGGSWMDPENELRVTNRHWIQPNYSYDYVGFRLCKDMEK
jgi:formylglycine-generating enzyme required for sulfatase activity